MTVPKTNKEKDRLQANSNFIGKKVIPFTGRSEITPFHNIIIPNAITKRNATAPNKIFKIIS